MLRGIPGGFMETKAIALESDKVRKARNKLLKEWEEQQGQITPLALREAAGKIADWIADHAPDRARIAKKGNLGLFNCNQTPAPNSKRVEAVFGQIKEQLKNGSM